MADTKTTPKAIVQPLVQKKIEKFIQEKGIGRYTITITPGSIKGDNYLGVIGKARIEGTDKEGKNVTFDWIVKSAPQMEALRNILHVDKVYAREVYVYENLFPIFKEFQDEKNLADPFNSTAPFVMSCMEDLTESLVLEDMKVQGYVMEDRHKPLGLAHVRLVMKTYGKLHALSYALKDQRPELFKQLAKNTREEFFACSKSEDMVKASVVHNQKAMDSLDVTKHAREIEIFKKFIENGYEIVESVMATTNEYSVIGHGDSWINNMLFKYDNLESPTVPTHVCLLDWQLTRYGSPAFDLSYFIFTCTDKQLRDEHYDQMIRLYYHTLCSHLIQLGSDPQKLLPFEALKTELKKNSIFGLYMSIMVLFLMTSEVDEIPEWQDKTTEEMIEVFNYKSKNESVYNDRVSGNIIDFIDKGYLDFF